MDRIDLKLLKLLQSNARYSLKQLSEKVYLSSPAVAARIEKLERDGIIEGYHASVNLEKMGYHITTFISVEMQPSQKAPFIEFIQNVPNVLECDNVTGSYTMLVKATFPSTADLDSFIGKLQHFGQTETHLIFSTPVSHRGIQIPDTDDAEKDS